MASLDGPVTAAALPSREFADRACPRRRLRANDKQPPTRCQRAAAEKEDGNGDGASTDVDEAALLDVLSRVQRAYSRLLRSNNNGQLNGNQHESEFVRWLREYELTGCADCTSTTSRSSSSSVFSDVPWSSVPQYFSSGCDQLLTSSGDPLVTSYDDGQFRSTITVVATPRGSDSFFGVQLTASPRRAAFTGCGGNRSVSVPPCLRPIEEEETPADCLNDYFQDELTVPTTICEDQQTVASGSTSSEFTFAVARRFDNYVSPVAAVASTTTEQQQNCSDSQPQWVVTDSVPDVRPTTDCASLRHPISGITCTSVACDVVVASRNHAQFQQRMRDNGHADVTETQTVSGLVSDAVIGWLDGGAHLFYVALASGASFAACWAAVPAPYLLAVVAVTSFVSFAANSTRYPL